MTRYKALAKAYLDQKGVKYSEPKDTLLAVTYKADNMSEITIIIDFQNEGNRAQFVCFSIGNFDKNQFAKGLVACNACNTKYRWVKYYIGDDGRVVVQADAILDEANAGEEVFELIQRMVAIIDESYPIFMKARWA